MAKQNPLKLGEEATDQPQDEGQHAHHPEPKERSQYPGPEIVIHANSLNHG